MNDPVAEFLAREDGALDDDIDVGPPQQQPAVVDPPHQGIYFNDILIRIDVKLI